MRASTLIGLVTAALVALTAHDALAQCGPGALGVSRTLEIDTTGGPAFGQVHAGSRDILKPGEVVLTFDDGPHKQFTPVILDALDQHCTKATFFMLGQRAMMYSDLVREVERRGHTVGTHTWSHANLQKKSAKDQEAEIELGISGVQKGLGKPAAPFFRFPYLATPRSSVAHLGQRNTGIFSIDVDSKDFRTRSPTVVIRNVMNQLKTRGRGIILFHDIQPSTTGAIGALLSDLKAGGYKVVHLVPKHTQTTIAAYDQRVGTPSRSVAAANVPVRHRAATAPAWEPRPHGSPAQARHITAAHASAPPPPPAQQAVAPVAPPPPVTARQVEGDDWRKRAFGGF
jgi:peptidoglycan/xylan/chitin deacetylase (PgdA/CDA1 family)